MKTGEKIRLARNSARLTQVGLAKRIGMYQSTVARWETDKEPPGIIALKKLSALFKRPVDYWISETKTFDLKDKLIGTLENGSRVLDVLSALPPTLPEYTKEDVSGTIKVSTAMFGYLGDYCIHLDDDTMEPKISRGSTCIIHTETLPQENAIMLIYLTDKGYIIRQVLKVKGRLVFKALNPIYKDVVTNNYRIIGKVIGSYQHH